MNLKSWPSKTFPDEGNPDQARPAEPPGHKIGDVKQFLSLTKEKGREKQIAVA
jgi:hypothetical protein